ncbi:DUF3293 domain-containing protein [Pleurocapsales cyanobacterium LEGE 10410]|nr:DUF3293 domain-containing protein [Pleurocapsales cyanobacterium LEGE 10410]
MSDLKTAYQQAIYEVYPDKQIIQLRIGQYSPQLNQLLKKYNCNTWAIITAFNPHSQCLTELENNQRHQSLIESLQPLQLTIIDALGRDDSGSWTPEKSLLILGIDRSQASDIGRNFEQKAIVYGELDRPPELQWL